MYNKPESLRRMGVSRLKNDSELVIGIVQAVGTDSSGVLQDIEEELSGRYLYRVNKVKVSQDVLGMFDDGEYEPGSEYDRIWHYIGMGNSVRESTGDNAILMRGVAANIHSLRLHHASAGDVEPLGRVAHIVDSIKHPEEIDFLRETYGDGFHLIGIFDSRVERLSNLRERKRMSDEQANELLECDEGEATSYGQHTRDAFQEADYFLTVTNDVAFRRANVGRLLELLFGNPFITPTFGEYAMFRAYVASLRSADLSRQIGAVVTRDDEVLAEGANDCAKYGGGLYWQKYDRDKKEYCDGEEGRDYTLGYDPNKKVQAELIGNILSALGCDSNEENIDRVKNAGVGLLTEYGRVVHGEMEALMMCARNGISTVGCVMYMTTFPCHNCAKHIIAAGIKKVVYIEPYPKSRALEFHTAEVTQDRDDDDSKVLFIPFYGVGPHRFADLFAMKSTRWDKRKRKNKNGAIVHWDDSEASLRNPIIGVDYLAREEAAYLTFSTVLDHYARVEEDVRSEGDQHERKSL